MSVKRVLPSLIMAILGIGLLSATSWAQDAPVPPDQRITKQIERMTKTLDLTETQQKMMRVILEEKLPKTAALRQQLKDLQEETEKAIDGVLTDEQREKRSKSRPDRAGAQRGIRPGQAARDAQGARAGAGLMGMLRDMNLSDDQKAQIREILKNRPENPRAAIQGVLTEEQKAQWKAKAQQMRRAPQDAPRGGQSQQGRLGQAGRMGFLRGVDLTEDQRSRIQEILKNRPENPRKAILEVLTEEQKQELEKKRLQMRSGEKGEGVQGQGQRRGGESAKNER
ncbi:MAG: hypothetical protein ABIH23_17755 [bacterium]